jgi:hypothetical protein
VVDQEKVGPYEIGRAVRHDILEFCARVLVADGIGPTPPEETEYRRFDFFATAFRFLVRLW